ncbi:hypothetical protein CEXT_738711 [Caerostris extrusa]|uniref:Uncharacterized protein n=1 Tax=Caerostris extrusa TaxID=172846 RepID=A0AAV4PPV6_CAEEX|nr:hypothetical protein CEXT_738711 [Caerostris extrusa]
MYGLREGVDRICIDWKRLSRGCRSRCVVPACDKVGSLQGQYQPSPPNFHATQDEERVRATYVFMHTRVQRSCRSRG